MGTGYSPGDVDLHPVEVAGEGLTSKRNQTPQTGSIAGWGQPETALALGTGHLHGDRDVPRPGQDINPQIRPDVANCWFANFLSTDFL